MLQKRGLLLQDAERAQYHLCKISYFRPATYPNVDLRAMGFPENWREFPLWQ